MKKRYLLAGLLVLALAISMIAVACGSTETEGDTGTTVAQTGPIKIGHIVDLTGYQNNVGFVMKAGQDFVFTDATVGGRDVVLVEADGKSTPEGAVEAAKYLVESEGVIAILGPTQIAQKEAVAAYCEEAQVPVIFYNPTPPELLEGNEWVIASGGTTLEPMTVIADYIYNDLGYQNIDVIGGEDTGAHAFYDPFVEHFEALGGTVVQWQETPYGEDYSVYLANLEDADALVTWYGGSAGISMLKQYIELGVNERMPLVGMYHGGMLDPFAMNTIAQSDPATAEALLGTKTVMAWDPSKADPVNAAWAEAIAPTLQYGPPGDDGYASASQGGLFLLEGLKATADNVSSATLRDALLQVDFIGPEGREYFVDGQNAATKLMYIVEVTSVDIPNVGPVYQYNLVKTYEDVPPEGLSVD